MPPEDEKPQAGDDKSQEDTSKPQAGDETKSDDPNPNSEAAKYRRKLREAEAEREDLKARLEELENSKLSEAERQQKAQEKFQQKIAEAERKAQEAERRLLSSKAVLKHSLPECLSEMLHGKDEDEVDDHARSLAADLDKWARTKYKPTPTDLEGGDRSKSGSSTVLDEKTKAAKVRETAAAF